MEASVYFFLQGQRRIGKSTVIVKTLDILAAQAPLVLGGFFTWNGGKDDPHVYMRPARSGREGNIRRLASWDTIKGGMISYLQVFERFGADLLHERSGAELIILDELGFLESDAPCFKQAVTDTLADSIPVLGVLRMGDIPWHNDIKGNPNVAIFDVNEKNRDNLPRELAAVLSGYLYKNKKHNKDSGLNHKEDRQV